MGFVPPATEPTLWIEAKKCWSRMGKALEPLGKSKSLGLKCTSSGSGKPPALAHALAMPSKVTYLRVPRNLWLDLPTSQCCIICSTTHAACDSGVFLQSYVNSDVLQPYDIPHKAGAVPLAGDVVDLAACLVVAEHHLEGDRQVLHMAQLRNLRFTTSSSTHTGCAAHI